jgi:2-C-methyl-D-erythritol 4-phosphate cytidylyltransferase/2-C-methyl-D-erythritol 2,4-cyclodiphosphate synthase
MTAALPFAHLIVPAVPVATTPASEPRLFVLIPCAGTGSRAGSAGPKQYELIAGRPMVAHTIDAFRALGKKLAGLWLVVAEDDDLVNNALPDFPRENEYVKRSGGVTRADTVLNGLAALSRHGALPQDWVLVHDAARCLITPAQIEALIESCRDDAVGGLLALRLADTLKSSASDGRVAATLPRDGKWLAQTPQMFRVGLLTEALAIGLRMQPAAHDAGGVLSITDEAGAMEAAGHAPLLVPGSAQNFKVTYAEDFALAEAVLRGRAVPAPAMTSPDVPAFNFRIGEGWDVHQLVEGRPLMLGGIQVPHTKGLLGHSDADVLLHAITDALLGAAALGDIGRHFPDTDPQFRGADSIVLLVEAALRVRATGWEIGNVDSTVIAQAPKLASHIPAMCTRIAEALGLTLNQVNVKAKTAEKLGPVGEGRAMEARATVLLHR